MSTESIQFSLNRRFAAPLPEFYRRRIIFWYDEDREFEDKLDEIELSSAKVVKLTGSNTFEVKKLLAHDDTAGNFLVYRPFGMDKPDDDWLINIELYSEDFRADLGSIWMDEMGLSASPVLHKQVRQYKRFFAAKDRRAKVSAFAKKIATAPQFHLAVMAAICGLKDMQPNSILRAVLKAGLEKETNTAYQALVSYNAQNPFWVMVAQATGYKGGDDVSLSRLAVHTLLTAATRTMRQEYLMGLDSFISVPHQAYCYDFISEWLRSEDAAQLYQVARYAEEEARLPQRFAKLSASELADYAERTNTEIVVEAIDRFETDYLRTAQDVLGLIDEVGSDRVLVHLDSYHMNLEEQDWRKSILSCRDKLGHVHLADNRRYYPGQGLIDFNPILAYLQEINYDRSLTLECYPYPDGITALLRGKQYLDGIMAAMSCNAIPPAAAPI